VGAYVWSYGSWRYQIVTLLHQFAADHVVAARPRRSQVFAQGCDLRNQPDFSPANGRQKEPKRAHSTPRPGGAVAHELPSLLEARTVQIWMPEMVMPPAVSAAEGINGQPRTASKESSLSKKSTGAQPDPHITVQEPWQSWGAVLRYVVFRLAQAIPTAALVWQVCGHH
jgi:hypothetical protein